MLRLDNELIPLRPLPKALLNRGRPVPPTAHATNEKEWRRDVLHGQVLGRTEVQLRRAQSTDALAREWGGAEVRS